MRENRKNLREKWIAVFMLMLVLLLGAALSVHAEETGEEIYSVSETVAAGVAEGEFPSNEEMAREYLNRAFYGREFNT